METLRLIHVLRHGPKDKNPQIPDIKRGLTPQGDQTMQSLGARMEILENSYVLAAHSKYERARQSTSALVRGCLIKLLGENPDEDELGEFATVYEDLSLGEDMAEMFSTDQLIAWKQGVAELGEAGYIDKFIHYRQQKPDEGTWSPYHIACGLAWSINQSICKADEYHDIRTEFKISHSGYIEALLLFLAEEQINTDSVEREGFRFVDKIGGIIEMGQPGVSFTYQITDRDERELALNLRGKNYNIDLAKLDKMAGDFLSLSLQVDTAT